MTVRYHCPHLDPARAPLASSYASSSTSLFPLDQLYFCEECDAIRCNSCVATEIASYYCPSCLFDVPSANVRADKNRCARHCYECPECHTFTEVQGTSTVQGGPMAGGPPFVLVCKGCRWTSREAGIEFEKNTGIAAQLQKMLAAKDTAQAEYDSVKDHLEGYMSTAAPMIKAKPTRHISHLTQMAARALNKTAGSAGSARKPRREDAEAAGWDEMGHYEASSSWGGVGLEGLNDVDAMSARGRVENNWATSWHSDTTPPQRVPLLTKLTKRCPHADCRHLLIQPDPKSTRFKIKMVASNYIPTLEVGRRRRRVDAAANFTGSPEDIERHRRDRRRTRREEVDEDMSSPLVAGQVYTFQVAFTNTSLDAIQIRFTSLDRTRVHVPTPHFTVAAPKDAWAYDEEDDEFDDFGTEGTSEDGSSVLKGTLGRKSRMSVLGSVRDKETRRKKEGDVDKKGNVTKVVVEVEVPPESRGLVEADFEVRMTYRVEEEKEYKSFTFWTRARFGEVL